MITYETTVKEVVDRESIIIDGQKVGEIWPAMCGCPGRPVFQCQVKVGGYVAFVGGIADTKGAALRAAVENARADAALLIAAADRLEGAL